jgi:hypothetical protein
MNNSDAGLYCLLLESGNAGGNNFRKIYFSIGTMQGMNPPPHFLKVGCADLTISPQACPEPVEGAPMPSAGDFREAPL